MASCRSTWSTQRQSVTLPLDLLNNGQPPPSVTVDQQDITRRRSDTSQTGGWSVAVVLAAFVVHCIVDGISYSFAVFYVDLLNEFTTQSHATLVLVGSLLPGTCLFVGPLVGGLANKLGCRVVTVCGSVLAASSIAVSSLSSHVNHLIATYGLLAGAGFGMMHLPSIIIVSFYFSRRRALATSVVLCGSGVGRLVFAPLSRYLIDKYGWRGANFILAAIILNGAACGCVFRCPTNHSAARRPSCEKRRRRLDSTGSLDGRRLRHSSQPQTDTDSQSLVETVSDPAARHQSSCSTAVSRLRPPSAAAVSDVADVSSPADDESSPATVSDRLTTVPDVEVDADDSTSTQSDAGPAAVVWVVDSSTSHRATCSNTHSLIDLNRPPSMHGPPSSSGPPSLLPPLSSRPDLFYTGSCVQVTRGGDVGRMTSSAADRSCQWSFWSVLRVMLDVSLFQRLTFVLLAVSVLLCYFGLLTSFTFIVDHAMMLGISKSRAAMLLSVLGVSSGLSRLLVGWVTDRPGVDSVVLYTVALLVAGASTCCLPALRSYQLLCGYQIVYGICCAVFITLKSILVVDLLGLDKLTTAYGILSLLEGVGSLAGTPLLGGLYDLTQSYWSSFVVAGCLLLLAGLVCIPLRRVDQWEGCRSKLRRGRTSVTVPPQPLVIVRNAL